MSDLVDTIMDAQAVNAVQAREIFNPTPETDSALEHAEFLLRTANDVQRPHAAALVTALRRVYRLNDEERDHERRAAGIADDVNGRVSNVHELVRLVRPILSDLANVMLERKHGARRADLRDIFARADERTLRSVSIRHLLGVRKYTRLVDELQAWQDQGLHGLGLPLTYESLGVDA